ERGHASRLSRGAGGERLAAAPFHGRPEGRPARRGRERRPGRRLPPQCHSFRPHVFRSAMTLQQELAVSPSAKLAVKDVSKSFRTRGGNVQALDRISLNVNEGEFVCLVGLSGCGKSTLLNIIAG